MRGERLTLNLILSNIEPTENARRVLGNEIAGKMEFSYDPEPSSQTLDRTEVLILQGKNWLTAGRIREMRNLRLIQSFSVGVEHLNYEIIPRQVIVCSNAGAFAEPIGEFVLGAVICLGRNLIEHDRKLKAGIFEHWPPGLFLKGKTMGIIGTGGIGQAVARFAVSFNMHTLGINTSGKPVPYFDEVSTPERLDSLMKKSDVIVVAVPLTNKTKNMIGKEELSFAKSNAIIVNVARGAIIDESALYEFLKSHPESKAAIDVWWKYPARGEKTFSQDTPIAALPNVLASPHFSDGVPEFFDLGWDSVVSNIARYLSGKPLKGLVNPEDYYGLDHDASHP